LALALLPALRAEAQKARADPSPPPSPAVTQELLDDMDSRVAEGDADAMFGLAVLCFFGEGVAQDSEKALALLEKAAGKGHLMSLYFLGELYQTGTGVEKDAKKAVKYFTRAADKGDEAADLALGGIYYYGAEDVKADPKKAFRHFSRAAEKGQYQAQLMLGSMYETGNGAPKDPAKSWEFFLAASENPEDRGEAALAVGDIYVSGRNPAVPQDLAKGRDSYRKAASFNLPEAAERLALLDRAKADTD
jgi:TPR repeat protein